MTALERTYVATCLAMPDLLDVHRLNPDDLVDEACRGLLRGLMSVRAKGGKASDSAVSIEAQRLGLLTSAEAIANLSEVEVEPDLEPVAERLRELAIGRRMKGEAVKLQAAYERGDLGAARAHLARLNMTQADPGDARVLSFKALLEHTLTEITKAGSEASSLIKLGTPTVDAAYAIGPGSMVCVGAQTNVGKTSLTWAWLMSMAGRGIPCGMISVEDREEDLGAKALGEIAGVNPARLWGKWDPSDQAKIAEALRRNHALPIATAWVGSRELDGVVARMEFMARVHGSRVIVVDYLQAIAHRPGKDIRQQIDATLAELISQAGRLKVGLVLCSQLARPDRGNPFKEPQLIDLKESGSIEQRSQCVVLLWRKNDQPGPVLAKVAKAKRQPAGRRFTLGRHPLHAGLVEIDALAEGESHEDEHGPDAYLNSMRRAT